MVMPDTELSIIGAGFGRTGTLSMKSALDILGLGPVHHMYEVVAAPEQSPRWVAALDDSSILRELLAGYHSAVDWPSCYYWRELMALYPEAKVILTHRESRGWYKSVHGTLFQFLDTRSDKVSSQQLDMATRLVMENTFDKRLGDEDYAISVYEAHNTEVKAAVPAERLLVFDVREGWAPLCSFLDLPVPEEPFPHTNSAEEMMKNFSDK